MADVPPVVDVPPEVEPAEQALRDCLQVCGFGQPDQNRIINIEALFPLTTSAC